MHSRTKAAGVIGSLAITATLLLAGCGGSSSTAEAPSAAASWNPPRPAGVPDADWADYGQDPATYSPEYLARACSENPPFPLAQIDQFVSGYVGSTPEEWKAWSDYRVAFLTPLCANLPSGAAAAPTEPSAEASAEGDAAASDMASEVTASGAFPPVVDGDLSYQAWGDGSPFVDLYITNTGDAPFSTVDFAGGGFGLFSDGGFVGTLEDESRAFLDATGCKDAEIPVGGSIVCSLSNYGQAGTFTKINMPSIYAVENGITGDGIDVPVNATDSVPRPS